MPYGIAKEAGGDSPENDAKMERCIEHVHGEQGVPKLHAILICKAAIQEHNRKEAQKK